MFDLLLNTSFVLLFSINYYFRTRYFLRLYFYISKKRALNNVFVSILFFAISLLYVASFKNINASIIISALIGIFSFIWLTAHYYCENITSFLLKKIKYKIKPSYIKHGLSYALAGLAMYPVFIVLAFYTKDIFTALIGLASTLQGLCYYLPFKFLPEKNRSAIFWLPELLTGTLFGILFMYVL